ncbi:sodium:proton antiporter [Legionella antarctica]|uniref:Sodium:proton antiporter n=1 Tax=Legionella antarctica TaxID=2708020 RepID=A0A6F8T5R0_9GAMM|nr:Na+/H+ antiporter subunit E [Legionella antarctica]BCA95789.1 sodium:proton antiporter [Legionella antarctica]
MNDLLIKFILIIKFMLIFIWQVLIANLRVAHDVITPRYRANPGVIAIPLDCKTDIEITLLAIIISLTPGTLALDVSTDKKKLYIHAMFITDKDKLIAEIKNHFEKPIMRILT